MPDTFTPEQISQILEEFFKVVGTRQYIGARYVPIFGRKGEESIEWDNTAPYEPLTIVLYQGNSYTSRQFVPVGVEITNQEFWAITGNYNAQVEMYRRETAAARKIAEAAQNDIDTLLPKADFSAENTVKDYIDKSVANVQNDIDTLLPKADFSAENTVKNYIDTISENKATVFDTVSEMKQAELKVGEICKTTGFHTANDNGGALYVISENGNPNEIDVIGCSNNLNAIFVPDSIINPMQLGAYGDGTHADDAPLNKCFYYNRCVDGLNKTYMLENGIVSTAENFIFKNATLIGTITNNNYVYAYGEEVHSQTGTINVGDLQLKTNVSLVSNKKYFVRCTNNQPSVSTYTRGVYLPMINYVYDGVIQTDVVNGTLTIYEGINVDVNNISIPNVPNDKSGMSFANCSGKVTNCFVNSNGGLMGIGVTGSDITVSMCEINGFLDIDLVWNRGGYGINAVGQNVMIENNVVTNCKHCLASGVSLFWSNNLTYRNNTLVQNTQFIVNLGYDTDWDHGFWAIIDFHALVTNAKVINNNIIALGRQTSALVWGNFDIRCKSLIIDGNTFFADTEQEKQFGALEQEMDVFIVKNNIALGEWYFNMAMTDDIKLNMTWENNYFPKSLIFRKSNGGNWTFKNNTMSRIVCLDTADNITLIGNTLRVYAEYNICIDISGCTHAYIAENQCTKISGAQTIICKGNATILNNLLINAPTVNDIRYHTDETAIANNYNQAGLLITGQKV